jgi:hypothetical protein
MDDPLEDFVHAILSSGRSQNTGTVAYLSPKFNHFELTEMVGHSPTSRS